MLLTVSFVLHVLSAALWTGATLFVVYAVLPRAVDGTMRPATFADGVHRLLLITRWTGVVLPVTGAYMIWVLYTPLELLTSTTRGWLVLVMLTLWGIMNGLIEMGVLRMRRELDPDLGWGAYMAEGFPAEGITESVSTTRLAAAGRPYLLASGGCAVVLLVDAALLAGGMPW
ncbi:copper resistance protein CopD [Halorubrum vacuolatum]|uniref:Copper resistance protein D n=1 Tax=Halorubrum vacuolatum TaxID=63740 RepID=A0A238UN28_HALVU|nr:copper resistance protein CopD [Halorubrum vacuolatum]SNR23455.1 hypothetical protein SAMN06264855_101120 [Halorubrum vacuolatum]